MHRYREEHREQLNERARKYQAKHREVQRKRVNDYHETKRGRAMNLLTSYVQMDQERRGYRPRLTQDDIIRICFSDGSRCVWCGETDWHKLGLDRIDTSKAHDMDNSICSCRSCNIKRFQRSIGDNIERLGLTVDEWLERNGATIGDGYITLTKPVE